MTWASTALKTTDRTSLTSQMISSPMYSSATPSHIRCLFFKCKVTDCRKAKRYRSLWELGLREAFWQYPCAFPLFKPLIIIKPVEIPNHQTFLKVPHLWIFRTTNWASIAEDTTGHWHSVRDNTALSLVIVLEWQPSSHPWISLLYVLECTDFCITARFLCEYEIHYISYWILHTHHHQVPTFIFKLVV